EGHDLLSGLCTLPAARGILDERHRPLDGDPRAIACLKRGELQLPVSTADVHELAGRCLTVSPGLDGFRAPRADGIRRKRWREWGVHRPLRGAALLARPCSGIVKMRTGGFGWQPGTLGCLPPVHRSVACRRFGSGIESANQAVGVMLLTVP